MTVHFDHKTHRKENEVAPVVETFEDRSIYLRTRYLDAFAELEILIIQKSIEWKCCEPENAPLSQRLKALADAKPNPSLSKENLCKLTPAIAEIQNLLPIRNTIVHSSMNFGAFRTREALLFQNVYHAAKKCRTFLILTEAEFEGEIRRIQSVRDRLQRLNNRPEIQAD